MNKGEGVKVLDYEFSRREIGFVLIIVALVIATGLYAWRIAGRDKAGDSSITTFDECVQAGNPIMESSPARCTADGKTFTQETAAYTDAEQTYTITYPTTLSFLAAAPGVDASAEQPAFEVYSLDPTGTEGQGMQVMFDKTGALAENILGVLQDNGHVIEDRVINGYAVKYARVEFNGDAEQYTDRYYLFANNGATLYFNYREKYNHQTTNTQFDNAEFIDDFEAVIDSVKFL